MTQIKLLFSTFAIVTFFASCNAQNSNNPKSFYSDTTIFKIDTAINNALIDGTQFTVQILRDKVDEHLETFSEDDEPFFSQSPITIILTNNSNGKVLYIKKFDYEPNDYPYINYSLYKGQGQNLSDNGKLYLMLNRGYGGSGSSSIRYLVEYKDGKINLTELFKSSGELTYIVYKKNDNEILVLDGIWNIKENETHFASHRYAITKYIYSNNSFDKKEIGQTKFKYSSLDEDKPISQILLEIKNKEPILLKGIILSEYKF